MSFTNNTTTQLLNNILTTIATGEVPGHTQWFDSGFNPITGYVVGDGKRGLILEQRAWTDDKQSTAAYLSTVAAKWKEYRHLTDCEGYGFWEYEGRLYVDPVTHVTDRTQAILMGMARGEVAIWDIDNQCCINMADYVLAERGVR